MTDNATPTADAGLAPLRDELDGIDRQLLDVIKARLDVCCRIAEHKREHGVPMMQPHRISAVQGRAAEYAAANGIEPAFLCRLFELIVEETCRLEDRIIES
jgi:chorismate mutase-like protein